MLSVILCSARSLTKVIRGVYLITGGLGIPLQYALFVGRLITVLISQAIGSCERRVEIGRQLTGR